MPKVLATLVLAMFFAVSWSFSEDDVWKNRNSLAGAKAAYEFYKAQLQTKQDFESSWKMARAVHFYAGNYIKDNDTKKSIYTEGKNAALKAQKLEPAKPEGWYWFGVCLGSWAEANGILDSLGAAGPIMESCTKAIKADPNFDNGAAYSLRGRVYAKAPGVISVGDKGKAESDYKKAISMNPNNRTAFRFYAELLFDMGQKDKAKEIIAKGLAIPLDDSDSVGENKEIQELKTLQEKTK